MRGFIVSLLLGAIARASRHLYRFETEWIETPESERWTEYRLVAVLNHTSLFEFLYAAICPRPFLRRIAHHGVVPVADKTLRRPIVGQFWKMVAGDVVPITRERDATWTDVMDAAGRDSMVILFPEGRMKRAGGLGLDGTPLTVRGGIADLMAGMPDGKLLLAYSQGLHHIQAPGQWWPRLFKTLRMRLQTVDMAEYRAELQFDPNDLKGFRKRVVADLTERRDRWCTSDHGGGQD